MTIDIQPWITGPLLEVVRALGGIQPPEETPSPNQQGGNTMTWFVYFSSLSIAMLVIAMGLSFTRYRSEGGWIFVGGLFFMVLAQGERAQHSSCTPPAATTYEAPLVVVKL